MDENNPYSTPKTDLVNRSDSGQVSRHKKNIIFDSEAPLPPRCIICNEGTDKFEELKLSHVNPWWYLLVLFNLLIFLIVAAFVSKRFIVGVPICELHWKKHKNRKKVAWIAFLVALILFLTGLFLSFDQENTQGILLTSGLALTLVAIITGFSARLLYISKRKGSTLWVRGCKPGFLDSLPLYEK